MLVLGSGGREHAIVDKLSQSSQVSQIYVAPGNGGTAASASDVDGPVITNVPSLALSDIPAIVSFVLSHSIALVVVGPEQPLVDGVADALAAKVGSCSPLSPSIRLSSSTFSLLFSSTFFCRSSSYYHVMKNMRNVLM